MSIPKKWLLFDKNDNKAELIAQKFNISPITAQILINRGITEESQVYDFINPDIGQFLNPFDMKNMKEATECISFHIEKGSKIAVFGDYDVDGITSTYILYDYLKNLGVDAVYYIPNRSDEGYGLNTGAVDFLCAEGVQLIITVDVGITAINEVDYIKSKGIDVVVTDHHTPIDKLPEANAVINPKIDGCKYANKELAGVGVAFKLVYALSGCKKEIIDKYSAFACIGTIADMVPLVGENRFIASYGLKCIPHCDNIGLKSLIEISNIDADCIDSGNISFAIAPRLNAAGRIDSAETSVNLFLTNNEEEAHRLASILDSENKERQDEEQKILESAIGIIEEQKLYNDNVIVVANHGWHHGIIGIVSSKITEKYYKPSTVISINDDGSAKASGRSISGFNLFDSLSACSDVLTKFGGHELAAGFSLNESDIDLFRNKINEYSKGIMTDEILQPKIKIEAILNASDITIELIEELKLLEPYGIGNRTPVFAIENAQVSNVKIHRSGKHAFLHLTQYEKYFNAPAFNMADDVKLYSQGDLVNIAGTLNINSYQGVLSPQFIVRDIKANKKSSIDIENLRIIFMSIKAFIENNKFEFKISELSDFISRNSDCRFGRERLKASLKIFEELHLIDVCVRNDYLKISPGKFYGSKCNIESSELYNKINNDISNLTKAR